MRTVAAPVCFFQSFSFSEAESQTEPYRTLGWVERVAVVRVYYGRTDVEGEVVVHFEVVHICEDVRIYDLQQIYGHGCNDGIVAVAAVNVPVILRCFAADGAVVFLVRISGHIVYVLESPVVEIEVVEAIAGDHQASVIDGNLPVLSVIRLSEAGKQYGIEGRPSRKWALVALVAGHAVHQRCPVNHSGAHHEPGSHSFGTGVEQGLGHVVAQSGIGFEEGAPVSLPGRFGLDRLLVSAEIVASGARESRKSSVYNRQLPVLSVVDLGSSRQHDGAGEHIAYLHRVLVAEGPEIFLEGKEFVRAVLECRAVVLIDIALREGLFLELGLSQDRAQECTDCYRYDSAEAHPKAWRSQAPAGNVASRRRFRT